MTAPLPLEEAQRRLLALAAPLGPETLPAEQAVGRYLWSELRAARSQPAGDMSAMDGYAVHSASESAWQVIGESAAGRAFGGKVGPGEAVRISTGALVPAGAQAILLQEEANRFGDRLSASAPGGASARYIRRRGFDFAQGQPVLPGGTRVGAAQLALAIGAGHGGALDVGRLPRLAVLDSGDELVSAGDRWDDHRLPASNGAMIAAMVRPLAADVRRLGPVRDRLDALAAAFSQAEGADVMITTGGASVGDHDLIRPALEAWGATIEFWRVALKPGKPLLVARKGGTVVLGLPGNPVSSYVTAFLFALPLLRKLAGAGEPLPRRVDLALGAPLPAVGNRLEFVRARLSSGTALPVEDQDSSALRALGASDVLIRREIGAAAATAGERVFGHLIENGGIG